MNSIITKSKFRDDSESIGKERTRLEKMLGKLAVGALIEQ
jgi:hypothetical protein